MEPSGADMAIVVGEEEECVLSTGIMVGASEDAEIVGRRRRGRHTLSGEELIMPLLEAQKTPAMLNRADMVRRVILDDEITGGFTSSEASDFSCGSDAETELIQRHASLRRRHQRANSDSTVLSGSSSSSVRIKLDLFLDQLDQRMAAFEALGVHSLDEGLSAAWELLSSVKSHCSRATEGFIGEGYKKAEIIMSLVEQRYQDAMFVANDTFPTRVNYCIDVMEEKLRALEAASSPHLKNHIITSLRPTLKKLENIDARMHHSAGVAVEKLDQFAKALRAGATRYLTYDELPFPWQNNQYIHRGYRFYESKAQCALSILHVHNESANIWTHLAGFIVMAFVGLYVYPRSPHFEMATLSDKLVFAVFVLAALKCLACSTIWHTFASVANLKLMQKVACMDYVGISVLISASLITMEYHGFYCQRIPQIIYMSFTCFLGILGVIIPWFQWFEKNENRYLRILFFISIALSGAFPCMHLAITQNVMRTISFYAPVIKSVLAYALGVLVYVFHFPECIKPGVFDLVGASHQLWHVAILMGIYYHYRAVEGFLSTSKEFACTAL